MHTYYICLHKVDTKKCELNSSWSILVTLLPKEANTVNLTLTTQTLTLTFKKVVFMHSPNRTCCVVSQNLACM